MTEKEKTEKFVREKLPELSELSFGCEVRVKNGLYIRNFDLYPPLHVNNNYRVVNATSYVDVPEFKTWVEKGDAEILGHPIKLNDWLRVLEGRNVFKLDMFGWLHARDILMNEVKVMKFNLTTGQPATEADYQKFNEICGV